MLKPKQKKLIPLLIEFGNIEKACKLAEINKTTYYEWLKKDKEFVEELERQQDTIYKNNLLKLKNLCNKAIGTFENLLDSKDESIQFRTSNAILDNTLKLIENNDIKKRIEALEERAAE